MTPDIELFYSVRQVFEGRPYLFEEIFNETLPELREEPQRLIRRFNRYTRTEQILMRVALDLWNGHGRTKLSDILSLDRANLDHVLCAIKIMGGSGSSKSKELELVF